MQNKSACSVSAFNNELKLKAFNVFQIESDGDAARIYGKLAVAIKEWNVENTVSALRRK